MALSDGVRTRRELVERLVLAELLARRGRGPLALRMPTAFRAPAPPRAPDAAERPGPAEEGEP